MRRATPSSAAWGLFAEISPDLALVQELGGVPPAVAEQYQVVSRSAAGNLPVFKQRFSTASLVRGTIKQPIEVASRWDWVNRELDHFSGNLIA